MDGPKKLPAVPTYELCPIIQTIDFGTEEAKDRAQITCVAAHGKNIYLGCSNGSLMCYTLDELADGTVGYTRTSELTLKSKSPIQSLQLAPTISKAIVLSDDTISFFSLPNLQPITADVIRSMKNALNFAVNETPDPQEPVGLAIVKRDGIAFWQVANKSHYEKELPAPAIMHARRTGNSVCVADTETYMIIDLQNQSKLPIHPVSLSPTWKILPKIEVSKHDEYLIVTCAGTSDDLSQVFTMGLFINGRGDPTGAPIEWSTTPECICVDNDLILSLHLDQPIASPKPGSKSTETMVEVRRTGSSAVIQSLPLPSSTQHGQFRLMNLARDGFSAPVNSRQEKLQQIQVELFKEVKKETRMQRSGSKSEDNGLTEPAGSGLTPPPTPKKLPRMPTSHSHRKSRNSVGDGIDTSRLPTSRILIATRSSVYAMLPSTLIAQVESLLKDGKTKDASVYLAQVQIKVGKTEMVAADLRYLNTRVGISYLFQTSFEDAGDALFRGELDPRWLMNLWPEWASVVRKATDAAPFNADSKRSIVELCAGLEKDIEKLKNTTLKEIVANYSPHLKPSTAESTTGQELQKSLEWNGRMMLAKYLRKFRTRRQFVDDQAGGMYSDPVVNRAVDTVSALLSMQTEDSEELQELRSLLDESPYLVLDELVDVLVSNGHIASLARMYEKRKETTALIELYIKVADGVWKDESISDPVVLVRKLLQSSKDRRLVQKHAIWLLKRDRSGGLKLLISNDSKKPRSQEEDFELLEQIQDVDVRAAVKFLEYLVLHKKTASTTLHTRLVNSYFDTLTRYFEDPKALAAEQSTLRNYLTSPSRSSRSFLFYLAFEQPEVDHKRVRLKLILMLQGSTLYDLKQVTRKLRVQGEEIRRVMYLESAILSAQAGDHKTTLSILVNDLQDSMSAEAYCSLGGKVVTPKIASAIGDRLNLADWAALVLSSEGFGQGVYGGIGRVRRQASGSSLNVNGSPPVPSSPSIPNRAVELTRMLLEVYMKAGESQASEASRLLNAQAVNLDAADIIPQMPESWSLDIVSSFVERSFRRSLHQVYEGQILKQLSAGQNLQTSELAFEAFADAGAMIEESNEDGSPGYFDQVGGVDQIQEAQSGDLNLKELSAKIGEKLAEKRSLDNADTRPEDSHYGKTDQ